MGEASAILDCGPVEISCCEPKKRRIQEEKYHAMINDFIRHGPFNYISTPVDFGLYDRSAEVAKALLICWFECDLRSQGLKLSRPSYSIIDPISGAPITVRASSKQFKVKEAAMFIEFLYSVGAEIGIKWSERVKGYDEYPELNNG